MTGLLILLFIVAAAIAVPAISRRRRAARREQLRRKPFPAEWRRILERNFPLYNHLPPPLQEQLHGLISIFLAEKNIEGAAGLEITDEIRVTVAGQACILLLNRETDYYPRLFSIVVYPHQYEVDKPLFFSMQQHIEATETRLGESWPTGAVVLAWDHVRQGAADVHDGHNLVFHEFAHQLDQENASADGIPDLGRTSRYITWARVVGREYEDLQQHVKAGMASLLDQYGATNEAEFFAVATECFFERPLQMKAQYPELYRELQDFYRQDPATYASCERP
jgi:MtfA peptidase